MSAPVPPSASDRLLNALRMLIRGEVPQLSFYGIYEYTIQSAGGTTISCTPADTTQSLPSLANVPIRTSVTGEKVTVPASAVGSRCLIAFVNADPTRPVCIGVDSFPGALPAARLTDTVVAGIFAGTITSGSTNVSIG